MGVRYNAEKKKIGNYYSTPIYSFRCKCHLCDGWFEIQTDPKVRVVVLSYHRSTSLTFPCHHVEHAICRYVWGEAEGGGLGPGGERRLRGTWYVHCLYNPLSIFILPFYVRNGSERWTS